MARASPGQFNYQALLLICMITATATRALRLFASKTLPPVMSTSMSTSVSTASRQQQQQQQHKQQVLIIAGPTGVGKSSVAAILSSQLKGMIVSADSVQTYRGVQIGANKPSQQERDESPHFLIDVADADETYNAADWREDALFTIDRLVAMSATTDGTSTGTSNRDTPLLSERQRALRDQIVAARHTKDHANTPTLPIVVGGTMMYLQWLVHGMPDAAKPSAASLTRALDTITSYHDFDDAAAYASSLDPAIAARVQTLCGKDWYRLRRILEIAYTALDGGGDMNALFTGAREGSLESLGYDVRCVFLCPTDRMQHTAQVDERCEQMLVRGLVQETTDLFLEHRLPEMATRAIGYRQVLEYLQRSDPKPNDMAALEQLIDDFTTATRRYAKKQMQWFRKSPEFIFVPVDLQRTDRVEETADKISLLASLPREEFDRQLLPTATEDRSLSLSQSERTKRDNEEQGKKMKYYTPKRYILKQGSKEYAEIMQQADDCTQRIQQAAFAQEESDVIAVNEP